jgi:hypothetical protein
MQEMEKSKLTANSFGMCSLLTGQYNFLKQSLNSMQTWCKPEFSHSEYQAPYVKPEIKEAPAPETTK